MTRHTLHRDVACVCACWLSKQQSIGLKYTSSRLRPRSSLLRTTYLVPPRQRSHGERSGAAVSFTSSDRHRFPSLRESNLCSYDLPETHASAPSSTINPRPCVAPLESASTLFLLPSSRASCTIVTLSFLLYFLALCVSQLHPFLRPSPMTHLIQVFAFRSQRHSFGPQSSN